MSDHRKTYRSRHKVLRSEAAGLRSGLRSVPAALVVILLMIPVDLPGVAECLMREAAPDQQAGTPCCPHTPPEGEHSDHNGSSERNLPASGDHSRDSHQDCSECMDCGCFIGPFSGNGDAVRNAVTQHVQVQLLLPQTGTRNPVARYTGNNKPTPGPLTGSKPIYLVNQVFLN